MKKLDVHLYEFIYEGHVEYAISTLPVEEVRKFCGYWDSGDVPVQLFNDTFEKGIITEIKSEGDLNPLGMQHDSITGWPNHGFTILDIMPYCTDERIENWEALGLDHEFFNMECDIAQFLNYIKQEVN